ncbi:MAG TPA: type II toxin-antitoxin system VapB family antitoxin [Dehalococcoidia bacterium]|jgi:anti-sigma28 factor (negative regulator of flagellin synthesis)
MRTTLDIDKQLLRAAQDALDESSASKAVNFALSEVVRRSKLEELKSRIGKGDFTMDWREMEEIEMREYREQFGWSS